MGDPVVGPADPETRRRIIEERRQRAIKEDRERRSTPSSPAPSAPTAPAPHREIRRGPAGRTVMDEVDRAQRGSPNELSEKIRRVDRETGFRRNK